jgi:hypothetical protein
MSRHHHKPFHFCLEGEIEAMTQITATVSLTVNPASAGALTFTPNPNLQAETVGVEDPGQSLGEVTGGVPPYNFTATGVPDGDSLAQVPDADGVGVDVEISGTPTEAGTDEIVLTINDSAGASAQARIPIKSSGRR